MSAARTAGAQHAKAMLLVLEADNADVLKASGELATPERLAPIVEAYVDKALHHASDEFRKSFCAALAEWLSPTVDGFVIGSLDKWKPLAEAASGAGS